MRQQLQQDPGRRRILAVSLCIALLTTKAASFSVLGTTRRIAPSCYYSSTLKAQEDEKANQDDEEEPKMAESTIRMDDGGSDLTNRFKYKVNALMGTFDPVSGVDDERQEGNILNAMLTFPAEFSFNVVGRTKGQAALQDEFVDGVKNVVASIAGDIQQARITPRGKSFTRVTIDVTVESAAMINAVYDGLDELEMTTMRY